MFRFCGSKEYAFRIPHNFIFFCFAWLCYQKRALGATFQSSVFALACFNLFPFYIPISKVKVTTPLHLDKTVSFWYVIIMFFFLSFFQELEHIGMFWGYVIFFLYIRVYCSSRNGTGIFTHPSSSVTASNWNLLNPNFRAWSSLRLVPKTHFRMTLKILRNRNIRRK